MVQRSSLLRAMQHAAAGLALSFSAASAQDAPVDIPAALADAGRAQAQADAALAEARTLLTDGDDALVTGSLPSSLPRLLARAVPAAQPLPPAPDESPPGHTPLRPQVMAVPAGDLALIRQVLEHYRKGRFAEGDILAQMTEDAASRLALEWAFLRLGRQAAGFERIARFSAVNSAFPMGDWLRSRAEEALFVERFGPSRVLAFFAGRPPRTGAGKVALARAHAAGGQPGEAGRLVRDAYRNDRTSVSLRSVIDKDFPGVITPADRRHLAERLAYDGAMGEARQVAQTAGPAIIQLVQVLAASLNETGGVDTLLKTLDPSLQKEPAVILARTQALRRAGKIAEAGQMLLSAPDDADRIIDGDEWWTERRMLARKLLDTGDAAGAYRIAALHHADSPALRVDAEVHAGWIALRFLGEPVTALRHFTNARAAALTPASQARADYWRGRALEAAGEASASWAYLAAAGHGHTYHGQLASAQTTVFSSQSEQFTLDDAALERATRQPALRAIRALMEAEARDLAQPLIVDAARTTATVEDTVALGDLVARHGLAKLTVIVGKLAQQRGQKAEDLAFPVFGIPGFPAVEGSAPADLVYSIARQESEFDPAAVSHAGARGLMQLMPATAQRTANRFKIPLVINDLTKDAALNARIGAAHLGELLAEYKGSYILSFAAYNAGGRRVKEWMTAYGDPRDPAIDPVDWIERIPITETRHYVQKILENLQVYRMRLNGAAQSTIIADHYRGARTVAQAPRIAVIVPPVPPPVLP